MKRPWLPQPHRLLGAALLLGCGVAVAHADDEPQPVELQVQVLDTQHDQLPDTQLFLNSRALAKELKELRERQKEEVMALTTQFLAAKDPARANALQRQILVLKLEGQYQLLELQLKHARENGQHKQLQEAEATLAQLREVLDAKKQKLQPMDGPR